MPSFQGDAETRAGKRGVSRNEQTLKPVIPPLLGGRRQIKIFNTCKTATVSSPLEERREVAQRSEETSSLSLPRDRLTKDAIYIFSKPLIFSFIICQSPRPFLSTWCLPAANDPLPNITVQPGAC